MGKPVIPIRNRFFKLFGAKFSGLCTTAGPLHILVAMASPAGFQGGVGGQPDDKTLDPVQTAKAFKYRPCESVYERIPGAPPGLLLQVTIWDWFAVIACA
jgi:hypothetical protein